MSTNTEDNDWKVLCVIIFSLSMCCSIDIASKSYDKRTESMMVKLTSEQCENIGEGLKLIEERKAREE